MAATPYGTLHTRLGRDVSIRLLICGHGKSRYKRQRQQMSSWTVRRYRVYGQVVPPSIAQLALSNCLSLSCVVIGHGCGDIRAMAVRMIGWSWRQQGLGDVGVLG